MAAGPGGDGVRRWSTSTGTRGIQAKTGQPTMWKYHFRGVCGGRWSRSGRLSGPAPGYACVLLDGTVLTNGSFHAEWRACHAVPARSLLLSFTSVQVATHAQRAAGQQVMGWGRVGSAPLAGRGHDTRAANNSALQVHVPPMAIFFV